MEQNNPFMGNDLELPVGLAMQLAQEPAAMTAFGRLTPAQMESVVRFVQSGTTGEDAKIRVDAAVERLRQGDLGFFQ